jgi:putative transport protein
VAELNFQQRYGVTITRIRRGEVELPPGPQVTLAVRRHRDGGRRRVVDPPGRRELGDSLSTLNHPQIIPIFVGIALGVIVGSIPFRIPGMPAPVKLGLAGGPLLVAIVLSRLGHVGPLVWHLPTSANFALREVGIVLFLSCVGVKSGEEFFPHADPRPAASYWDGVAARDHHHRPRSMTVARCSRAW